MVKKILINGKIWTENPDMEWAEAIAIDEDKFVAVGSNDEVKSFVESQDGDFEVVDLQGKTVLPGLMEKYNGIMLDEFLSVKSLFTLKKVFRKYFDLIKGVELNKPDRVVRIGVIEETLICRIYDWKANRSILYTDLKR